MYVYMYGNIYFELTNIRPKIISDPEPREHLASFLDPPADAHDLMGGSKSELQDLTTRLEEKTRAYGMEVNSERSKVLVDSTNQNTPINITMKIEDVSSM